MRMMHTSLAAAALLMMGSLAHAAGTASLTSSGYSESFDSLGTAGTTITTGWSLFTGNSGTSNTTWASSITANGANSVATMVATSGALTATSAPTTTNNNGFNAAFSSSNTADRLLATSPTTVSGAALQLTLVNNTGASFTDLLVSYDTRRFTAVTTANELPGYELFYSLNGSSWTNVAALNPTIASVPNTVGVTSTSNAVVSLGGSVANGGSVYLRWVDDNALQTSPDQILGLNNVSISSVPDAPAMALMLVGLVAMARRRRS